MSDFEYGTVEDADELEALGAILVQSFNFKAGGWERWRDWCGKRTFRVVRRGAALAGGLGVHDFGQWFGGRCVPMGGIAAVGVEPGERGTGAAAELMAGTVRELRDRGVPLSVLFASTQRLYRKAGYEQAGLWETLRAPLKNLRPLGRELEMTPLDRGDHDALHAVHDEYARRHDGNLRRIPEMWSWMLDDLQSRPHLYRVGPADAPEGYLIFRQPKAENNYDVSVRDMVALTPRALSRIWSFLADHRSLAHEVEWRSWPADPSLLLFDEQPWRVSDRMIWMLRINDVAAALAARGYPAHVEERLDLVVSDDVIPENAGRFVLRVADGVGTVEEGGEGRIGLDVRTLAPLYTGFHTAENLRDAGLLDGDDASIRAATRVFAGPTPWMPDTF